ncbi:hypothetical protein JCM8547_000016 [Rhodosporidiobolus lusitaniae]
MPSVAPAHDPLFFPLPTITPLVHPPSGPSSTSRLGAVISNLSLQDLFDPSLRSSSQARSTEAFKQLEKAVYEHLVVVVKGQEELAEDRQFAMVRAFDPSAPDEHGHQDATTTHKGHKSLLFGIGNESGRHPEVKLVGGGKQGVRFGGRELRQADHTQYHFEPLTEEEREAGFTRWHRWHMDASLFRTSLPLVTSLFCLSSPSFLPSSLTSSSPSQCRDPLTVRWDDHSGLEMKVHAGSTGFIAGERMWERLSEEERRWAEGCRVEYAPWPYQWSSTCKGNSNGLGSHPSTSPLPLDELPDWDEKKEGEVKVYPMVWTCPKTGRKGIQVHPVAVRRLLPAHEPPIEDLQEVRKKLDDLQRPALVPENIWAPAYEVGDLVIFNNRAVYHSATDYPEGWKATRTMLQAHVAASFEPK